MYYGKSVFVCESEFGVLVSGKRIFRLFKKFGECTVNLSNWYSGWIRYIRYKCLRYLLKADLVVKKGEKRYLPHFCRLPLGVGTLRNQSLIGFFETLNSPIKCSHVTWFPHVKCLLTKWLGVFVCSDAVIKSSVVLSFFVPAEERHEKTLRSQMIKSIVTSCVLRGLIFPAF